MRKVIALIALFAAAISVCELARAEEKETDVFNYNDFIWLKFDFNGSLNPTAGAVKDEVKIEFKRPNSVVHPYTQKVYQENEPCFVKGFSKQGLFIGQTTENMLSPEMASMEFKEAKLPFVTVFEDVKYRIVDSKKEALFDKKYLNVNANEKIRGGISLNLDIPGGRYKRGAYHIFVFSFYIKGKGIVQVVTDVKSGVHDTPKSVKLTDEWQRISLWVASKKKTTATVNFRNMTGLKCDFSLDGLQLERKKNVEAVINRKRMEVRAGTEFTPGPWMAGGKKYNTDLLKVSWNKEYLFPVEEGTINLWLRPIFYRRDAQVHELIFGRVKYYDFMFGADSLDFLRDVRPEDDVNNSIEVARPKTMRFKKWCMLTVTWSNNKDKLKLYYNGRRIGFNDSDNISLNRDPEIEKDEKIEQIKYELKSLVIGSSGDREYEENGLMGVIDDLTIFSRALNGEQIRELYPLDDEDDD